MRRCAAVALLLVLLGIAACGGSAKSIARRPGQPRISSAVHCPLTTAQVGNAVSAAVKSQDVSDPRVGDSDGLAVCGFATSLSDAQAGTSPSVFVFKYGERLQGAMVEFPGVCVTSKLPVTPEPGWGADACQIGGHLNEEVTGDGSTVVVDCLPTFFIVVRIPGDVGDVTARQIAKILGDNAAPR